MGEVAAPPPRPVVRGLDSVPAQWGRSSSLYPIHLPGTGEATGPRSPPPPPMLAPDMRIGIQLHSRPLWPHHLPPADVAAVSRPQRYRLETVSCFLRLQRQVGGGDRLPCKQAQAEAPCPPLPPHPCTRGDTHTGESQVAQQMGCSYVSALTLHPALLQLGRGVRGRG